VSEEMKKISIIILSLIISIATIHSQEILLPLQENPTIKNFLRMNPDYLFKSSTEADTLTLPFFDDFSANTIFPADSIWEDNDVFVNRSFSDRPPTIGAATFDALDGSGSVYVEANSTGFFADYLTSRPLDLDGIQLSDSLFLSFFYQSTGLGDEPELYDSLYLELFSPETELWYAIWAKNGETKQEFKHIVLNIPDSASDGAAFYERGFKFRFGNRSSLTGLSDASWASNSDQWHIDYVHLDTGRFVTDTVITDLAFLARPNYLLKDYTAMPWRHYIVNSVQMGNSIDFLFYNYHNEQIALTKDITIKDLVTGTETIILQGAGNNYDSGEHDLDEDLDGFFFNTNTGIDEVSFKVETVVNPGPATTDFITHNDTSWYIQDFKDYYAYDDGSSESGYGLGGVPNGKAALKFQNYNFVDSIRGVDIFFNRTIGDANQKYFYLTIWDHDASNNQPGEILFSQIGVRPEFEDSLNKFHRYHLQTENQEDTAFVVPEIFYVGWKQTTIDMLNIGFDKNTILDETNNPNIPDPLYFNVAGGWQKSSLKGALMIRPIFSDKALLTVQEPAKRELSFRVYPNPANNHILFKVDEQSESYQYGIYDLTGRIISSGTFNNLQLELNTSNYTNGIYFMKLHSSEGAAGSHKFMVQH
jgi:hypothetical protein